MTITKRIILSLAVGIIVGLAAMTLDKMRGAEWQVSPEQIAEAQQQGQIGHQSRPGTVTVLPIRSEIADLLPFSWMLYGAVAAVATLVLTRRKKAA